jgi:hypothetical protein
MCFCLWSCLLKTYTYQIPVSFFWLPFEEAFIYSFLCILPEIPCLLPQCYLLFVVIYDYL